jgi:hypothetical protein
LSNDRLLREVRRRVKHGIVALEPLISSISSSHSTEASSGDEDEEEGSFSSGIDKEEVAEATCDVIAQHQLPVVSFSLTWSASPLEVTVVLFLDSIHNHMRPPAAVMASRHTINFVLMSLRLPMPRAMADLGPRPPLSQKDAARFRALANEALLHFRSYSNVIALTAGYASLEDEGRWSDEPHWLVFVHHADHVPWGEDALPRHFRKIPVSRYEGRYMSVPGANARRFETVNPSGVYRYIDPATTGCQSRHGRRRRWWYPWWIPRGVR